MLLIYIFYYIYYREKKRKKHNALKYFSRCRRVIIVKAVYNWVRRQSERRSL